MPVQLAALRAETYVAPPNPGTNPIGPWDRSYFAANSGLTPPQSFSLADHKRAFYRQTVGTDFLSVADLERQWLRTKVTGHWMDTNADLWAKLRALG